MKTVKYWENLNWLVVQVKTTDSPHHTNQQANCIVIISNHTSGDISSCHTSTSSIFARRNDNIPSRAIQSAASSSSPHTSHSRYLSNIYLWLYSFNDIISILITFSNDCFVVANWIADSHCNVSSNRIDVGCFLSLSLSLSCVYIFHSHRSVTKLEDRFKNLKRSNGSPVTKVYFNKVCFHYTFSILL
jgi:hypothetical protein